MNVQLLVIRIEDLVVNTKSGIAKESKNPYTIHEQRGYACLIGSDGFPEKYPAKMSVNVESDEHGMPKPYPVGEYTLAAESFMVGDFGQLRLGRMKLIKLDAKDAQPAPARKL